MQAAQQTVLVVGGSGYLGQFLVKHLAQEHKVSFTFHSTSAPNFGANVQAFWVRALMRGCQQARAGACLRACMHRSTWPLERACGTYLTPWVLWMWSSTAQPSAHLGSVNSIPSQRGELGCTAAACTNENLLHWQACVT